MQRLSEVRVQGCALPGHGSLLQPQQHPLKPLNFQEMGPICSQKEKPSTNIWAAQIQCTRSRRITALQRVLLAAEEVTDVQLGRLEMEHSVVTVRSWPQLPDSPPSSTVWGDALPEPQGQQPLIRGGVSKLLSPPLGILRHCRPENQAGVC